MALQSSGAISLANLQGEYGGSNPISLSEYYRNGPYVPNSISTGNYVREPSSGDYYDQTYNSGTNTVNYEWQTIERDQAGVPFVYNVYWNYTKIYGYTGTYQWFSSITSGAYTYYRGNFRTEVNGYNPKSNTYPYLYHSYGIYRSSGSSTTTYVNQNVPTGGTISLSQFYGGRKT